MKVRPYRPADAAALARLYRPARRLPEMVAAGARAWVAEDGGNIVGYASVAPVPGLPQIGDLDGAIAPGRRREGLGSRLLAQVIEGQRGTPIGQIAHAVSHLESGAAHFLRARGFYPEHEEWWLERSLRTPLPAYALPAGCHLRILPRPAAIDLFRALYERSFGGTPWYQPYTTPAEVAAELERARDLLFLFQKGEAAGFVWTRLGAGGMAQIEPFGVAAEFQGRGYGRALLRATLYTLAGRGAGKVYLGVWRRNRAALALYQEAGLRHTRSRTYLALDL